MKRIGVLFSGSGVYDGTEIQEAVFTLLAIAQRGYEAVCMAPNVEQHHVVNHLTGEPMDEVRNVLVESARIARGAIKSIEEVDTKDLDALVIPGGFGTAKNHTKWAFEGPEGSINQGVGELIRACVNQNIPLVGLCMGPTTIAKALEGTSIKPSITVGSTQEPSPYDISGIMAGMNATGAAATEKTLRDVEVDEAHHIITAPCYMMEGNIAAVQENIQMAFKALDKWL